MAQFKVFDIKVEVSAHALLSVIDAFPEYLKSLAYDIIKENGIDNLEKDQWYRQTKVLAIFKDIDAKFGEHTLFEIGKAFMTRSVFPENVDNLNSALLYLNVKFEQNHKGGNIGSYKLISFDDAGHKAIMQCHTPYPCDFDRGVLTGLSRKFIPPRALTIDVTVDKEKPNRKKGADESWYIITW